MVINKSREMRSNQNPKSKKPLLVFDFDGTIADTFELVLNIFQEISGRIFSKEEVRRSRDLSTKEILKELKIPVLKIPFFTKKARQHLGERILLARPFEGLSEILEELDKVGYRKVILTSNSRDNVTKFLHKYQLEDLFQEVWADIGIFSKVKAFRKLAKQENRELDQIVSIGDEIRDIEAAKKTGVISVAVTWGFDSKKLLQKTEPDFLVEQPEELRRVVKIIQKNNQKT
jgi:phosphoglycolate phosphatase-like HAD superfamily hydrolase